MFNGDTLKKLENENDLLFELQFFIKQFEEDRWEIIINDAIEEINDDPDPTSRNLNLMHLWALIQKAKKSEGLKDRVIPAGEPIELEDNYGKLTIEDQEVNLAEDNNKIRGLLDIMEGKLQEKIKQDKSNTTTEKLTVEHVKNVCKIGTGESTCSFLMGIPPDSECAKGKPIEQIINSRREEGTMSSKGDNCDGRSGSVSTLETL